MIDKIEKRLIPIKEKQNEKGTEGIDGDIPKGDKFKGSKEVDIEIVTKLFAEGKINLHMSHEYYVMSITSSSITLRNPHNNETPGGKIVTLSLSDYRKYFENLKYVD